VLVVLVMILTMALIYYATEIERIMRIDGRRPDEMRPVEITTGYLMTAEGSAVISVGNTRVLCAASVEETVRSSCAGRAGAGDGRVFDAAARHSQAHASEAAKGKLSGRTQEIQRLIGRSLRSVIDLAALGERTVTLDCDVLQADGRHAHSVDHRGLRGAGARPAPDDAVRHAQEDADERLRGGYQRGIVKSEP